MITELQSLVVRLVGDGSSYTGMLKEAEKETEQTASKIESLGASAAGFLGALGVTSFLEEAKQEWIGAETALFELTAALKANGEGAQEAAQDMAEFATELQGVTTASDESILSLLKTATTLDLVGDSAKRATKEAMALGAASGAGAQSALRLTAAMEKGDVERAQMYSRMIPQLRGIKDEAEFIAKYQKLVLTGQITLADELNTEAGKAAHFANQWSDALEGIGKAYTETGNPVRAAKSVVMEFWGGMNEGTQKAIVQVGGFAAHITMAMAAMTAMNTLLPGLRGNLLAVAKNPFLWAAAGAIAVAALTKELLSQRDAAKELGKQLESLAHTSKGYREAIGTVTAGRLAKDAGNQANLEEYRKEVEQKLRIAQDAQAKLTMPERDAKLYDLALRKAPVNSIGLLLTQKIFELEALALTFSKLSGGIGGPEHPELVKFREQVELAKKETEAWRTALEQVDRELAKLDKQKNLEAVERMLKDARKAWKDAGMDAEALARRELQDKDATESQLNAFDRANNAKKLLEQLAELRKQAREAGLTERELAMQRAKDANAGPTVKSDIKALLDQKEQAELLAKTLEDLKTPQQRLAEETKQLNQLYFDGKLTADQYAEANQRLRDSLLGVAAAEAAAIKFGSHQDVVERRKFFDSLNLSPGSAPPPKPDFNAMQGQQAAAQNNDLLRQVLQKLNDAGVFNIAFIGGGP